MNVSVNLEYELKASREANEVIERNCSTLQKENKVLREVLADEINRRIKLENLFYTLQRKDQEKGEALYLIRQALEEATRKEELVKTISKLINRIDF